MSSLNFDDDPFGAPTNAPLSSSGGGGFDDFDAPAPVQQKQQPAAFPASTFQSAPAEPAAETALSQWQARKHTCFSPPSV